MNYYCIISTFEKGIPLLDRDTGSPNYLYEEIEIENPARMIFRVGEPIPRKIIMADYLSSPYSVISEKAKSLLCGINMKHVQFLPATINLPDGSKYEDYCAIHAFAIHSCLDLEKSDCIVKSYGLAQVKKLVLDPSKLSTIPLEERMIFRMEEDTGIELFHESVVEKLRSEPLKGLKIMPLQDWNSSVFFS